MYFKNFKRLQGSSIKKNKNNNKSLKIINKLIKQKTMKLNN